MTHPTRLFCSTLCAPYARCVASEDGECDAIGEWEHYYERAAIAEYDGGLPRAEAEARALAEVLAARDS